MLNHVSMAKTNYSGILREVRFSYKIEWSVWELYTLAVNKGLNKVYPLIKKIWQVEVE